ncbi:MAG: hypothetical protein B7Y09_21230 [Polaromonas sp. 24-63-21]|nr:MAG: hypothetical protein B7Y09_21230 [Polaromonas sp. 24-63-21]
MDILNNKQAAIFDKGYRLMRCDYLLLIGMATIIKQDINHTNAIKKRVPKLQVTLTADVNFKAILFPALCKRIEVNPNNSCLWPKKMAPHK